MTTVDVYRANKVLIIFVFKIKTTKNKLRVDNFQKTKRFVNNPQYRTIACAHRMFLFNAVVKKLSMS